MASGTMKNLSVYSSYIVRAAIGILALPIVSKSVTRDDYGKFLIELSIAAWLSIIVEYGFNLSGSRKIAISTDPSYVSRVATNIFASKLILSIFAVVILLLVNFNFHLSAFVSIASFIVLQGFVPYWCFQGTNLLHIISFFDIFARFIHLIVLIIIMPITKSASSFFDAGVLSFLVLNILSYHFFSRIYKIRLGDLSFAEIRDNLGAGFNIFLFTSVTSIYNTASTFILGFYAAKPMVADYGVADRIVKAVSGVFTPVNNIIFPKSVNRFHVSKKSGLEFIRQISIPLIAVSIVVYILLFFMSPFIVNLLFGSTFYISIEYIRILGVTVVITVLNNILGYHIMFANNMDKTFNIIYITVSVFSVLFMLVILPNHSAIGMIAIIIGTEFLAFAAMLMAIYRWKGKTEQGNQKENHAIT